MHPQFILYYDDDVDDHDDDNDDADDVDDVDDDDYYNDLRSSYQ